MWLAYLTLCGAYPTTFWHFNSQTDPGPDVKVANTTVTADGYLNLSSTSQGYAVVSSTVVIGGPLTFIFRIQPSSTPQWSRVFDFGNSAGDSIVCATFYGKNMTFVVYTSAGVSVKMSCNMVTLNQWNVITIISTLGTTSMYNNGQFICSSNLSLVPTITRTNQYIGKSNGGDPYWTGYLDFLWHIPRAIQSSEVASFSLNVDMLTTAWKFQSTSALDLDLTLYGSPDLTGGSLNLIGNTSQYVAVTDNLFGGYITFAARAMATSYQSWAKIFDFGTSGGTDGIALGMAGSGDQLDFYVSRGSVSQHANCPSFWQTGVWIDVVASVSSTGFSMYKNGVLACTYTSGWTPNLVNRTRLWIAESSVSTDPGWVGSISWVARWDRNFSSTDASYITSLTTADNVNQPLISLTFSNTTVPYPFTVAGNPTISQGLLRLNGSPTQYINISKDIIFGTPFTFAIRLTSFNVYDGMRIMEIGAAPDIIFIRPLSGGVIRYSVYKANTIGRLDCNYGPVNGTTFHLVITHDGSIASMYKDGVLLCSGSVLSAPAIVRPGSYVVGRSNDAAFPGLLGSIDHWKYWNRALTATDVSRLESVIDYGSVLCPTPLITAANVNPGTCVANGRLTSSCYLACNPPYMLSAKGVGKCTIPSGQEGARWVGQSITCKPACSTPASQVNGVFNCPIGVLFQGTSCTRTCNIGFQSSMNKTTCQANFTWSPVVQECDAISCSALSLPFGDISCSGSYGATRFSSTCVFSCISGFTLSGPANTVCLANRTWSNSIPICIPPTCPAQTLPWGFINCNNNQINGTLTYDTLCTYSCALSHRLNGTTQGRCQPNSQWSPPLPECDLVTCPAIQAPINGTIQCDTGISGFPLSATSTCVNNCNTGFVLTGTRNATCLGNATWSAMSPTCVDDNECPRAPCPYNSTCWNFVGGYACGPAFTTPVTSVITGSNNLSLTTGEDITFRVYTGLVVNFDINTLIYTLKAGLSANPCTNVVANQTGGLLNVTCGVKGLGKGIMLSLPFTWTVSGASATVFSPSFNFPSPTIAPATLRLYGYPAGTSLLSVDYVDGDTIAFNGTGFLPDLSLLSVTYGIGAEQSTCTLIIGLCTATVIVCTTQPFSSGSNMRFVVNANGQRVTGNDTLSVVNVPNILSVVTLSQGCLNASTFVYDCPTVGGAVITITANYVSPVLVSGFIAGLLCTHAQPLTNDSSPITKYFYTCTIQPGTGYNQTVILASDGKYSRPQNFLSYAPPKVNNITGCTQVGFLSVTACNRQGGTTLVLLGNNFGPSGSSVSIGAVRCVSTSHDYANPHQLVYCTLPPGFGMAQQVQLFQAAGPTNTVPGYLDYVPCGPGQFQNGSLTTCGTCTPGRYSNSYSQLTCAVCDPGRFAVAHGSVGCDICPRGSAQFTGGASYCQECTAGFYAASDGAVLCFPCDAGTIAGSNGSSSCDSCSPGTFSQKVGNAGASACQQCDEGYYSSQPRQASCQECPVGKFANVTGSPGCTNCPPGYEQSNSGSSNCQACELGTYTSLAGRSDCSPCDSGRASRAEGATACDICAAGSVSARDLNLLIGPTTCTECGPGHYTAMQGQAVCVSCAPGTVAAGNGSTSCELCDPGSHQALPSSSSCVICPIGTYSGMSGRPECTSCGSGSWSDTENVTACALCGAGSFSVSTFGGVTGCVACVPGTYVDEDGQVACLQCAVGYYAPYPGSTVCTPCPAGSATPSGGSRECSVCLPGRYTDIEGLELCLSCPAGQYSGDANATTCDDCPKGSFQPVAGSSSCNYCPLGKYSAGTSQENCALCPTGKYSNGTNTSTCMDCGIGEYQDNSGSSSCLQCLPGSAGGFEAEESCIACAAGSYSAGYGNTTCDPCDSGTYQAYSRQTHCDPCSPGYFSSNGSVVCTSCPAGLVAPLSGASVCLQCPNNSVADPYHRACNCLSGYFFDPVNSDTTGINGVCRTCPIGADCTVVGVTRKAMATQDGYFLTDAESLTYQRCLSPKSCVSGNCSDHRTGLLCNECEQGYSMSEWTKTCQVCAKKSKTAVSMAFTVIALIIAVSVLYVYIAITALQGAKATETILAAKEATANANKVMRAGTTSGGGFSIARDDGLTSTAGTIGAGTSVTSGSGSGSNERLKVQSNNVHLNSSVTGLVQQIQNQTFEKVHSGDNTYVMKILVNFFQVVTALIGLPVAGALAFPTYYMIFLSYFKFFNIDFIPWQNVACLIPMNFYTRMVVLTIVPFGVVLMLAFVLGGVTLVLDSRDMSDDDVGRVRRMHMRLIFLRAAIFTGFMLYPIISSAVLSHFACIQVGTKYLLITDFGIECYTGVWKKWTSFAVIMILVYPVGIPSLYLALLYRFRNRLQSPFATLALGLLYESYVPRVWWFEVLVMVVKLVLTSLLQFLPLSLQLPIALVVEAFFLITLVLVQPEMRERNWLLHLLANVEILLLLLLWHFSYKENVTSVPVAIDASVSALFISLTVCLVALLFLDLFKFMKNKIMAFIRHSRTKNEPQSHNGSSIRHIDESGTNHQQ